MSNERMKWHVLMRRAVPGFAAAALALASALASSFSSTAFAGELPFYEARPAQIQGMPGSLIRTQPMADAPPGTRAWRILYRSTDPQGKPIAVSGVVIAPEGKPPEGGRPVVAWAHPTSGVVPQCAPSLAHQFFRSVQGLRAMLDLGDIVVATDYPGLGTPGPHPYLIGDSEGRAVLDSVRAAHALPGAGAGTRYAIWGHSQGGHAALFAARMAAAYAPELRLEGIAVAAPATDLETLMRADADSSGGRNLTAMTLWSWSRVFGLPIAPLVEPQAMAAVDALSNECIESWFDMIVRSVSQRDLEHGFLKVPDITRVEPWQEILHRNIPGPIPSAVPLFIAQGDSDALVEPSVTRAYAAAQCRQGSAVALSIYPGVGHGFIGRDAAPQAVQWIADRFAGRPAPDGCAQVQERISEGR